MAVLLDCSFKEKTAEILQLDVSIIKMLNFILCTLSSGYVIDSSQFRDFCIQTAERYMDQYPWYYIPLSLHRILIYGWQVVDRMALPIGILSEGGQEARNKDFKKFREFFSRKCSRSKTNEDLLRRLMCSSDPIISDLRTPHYPKEEDFPDDVLELLKEVPLEDFV